MIFSVSWMILNISIRVCECLDAQSFTVGSPAENAALLATLLCLAATPMAVLAHAAHDPGAAEAGRVAGLQAVERRAPVSADAASIAVGGIIDECR